MALAKTVPVPGSGLGSQTVLDPLMGARVRNAHAPHVVGFDESLYIAGRERFRAIFLTSVTTIAGLAPIILEKSFQAQLLKPMAISIAYGIGYATLLTLILLPILLSLTNSIKVIVHWLYYGEKIAKRDIEAPVIEQNIEK